MFFAICLLLSSVSIADLFQDSWRQLVKGSVCFYSKLNKKLLLPFTDMLWAITSVVLCITQQSNTVVSRSGNIYGQNTRNPLMQQRNLVYYELLVEQPILHCNQGNQRYSWHLCYVTLLVPSLCAFSIRDSNLLICVCVTYIWSKTQRQQKSKIKYIVQTTTITTKNKKKTTRLLTKNASIH